jgi:tungstate transport system ATP-binding protein
MTDSILPLEFRRVSFKIKRHRLIKDISFRLEDRSRTIIIGPNGAGKSLLLRLCHGLLQPSEGEIIWHGANNVKPQARQSMVFQRPVMLRRTARANMDFALSLQGIDRARRPALVDEALAHVGLGRLADTQARALSFGEQQKLALARAWALRPEVLFLDEPTANLDPPATNVIEKFIADIQEAGTKIVLTTHDLDQARRLADDVMFMHRGRLIEHSPAETFFTRPDSELARKFIGGELLWWSRKELTPPDDRLTNDKEV